MKKDNLHEFINRYEENINLIYGDVHDELFKWQAMKVWRDEWFKPDTAFASFADRFSAARKEFSLFIDNSRNFADGDKYLLILDLKNRNVFFDRCVGGAGYDLFHLLTAAHCRDSGLFDDRDDFSAGFANVEFHNWIPPFLILTQPR